MFIKMLWENSLNLKSCKSHYSVFIIPKRIRTSNKHLSFFILNLLDLPLESGVGDAGLIIWLSPSNLSSPSDLHKHFLKIIKERGNKKEEYSHILVSQSKSKSLDICDHTPCSQHGFVLNYCAFLGSTLKLCFNKTSIPWTNIATIFSSIWAIWFLHNGVLIVKSTSEGGGHHVGILFPFFFLFLWFSVCLVGFNFFPNLCLLGTVLITLQFGILK